jgi:hypothetical protein
MTTDSGAPPSAPGDGDERTPEVMQPLVRQAGGRLGGVEHVPDVHPWLSGLRVDEQVGAPELGRERLDRREGPRLKADRPLILALGVLSGQADSAGREVGSSPAH